MATKKASGSKKSKSVKVTKPREQPVEAVPVSPTLPFEIDPQKIEASLNKLKDQVVTLAKKGRYTKVRFKFRGKQLLPDLPLAAVAAVEGVTFYWAGLLRMLVFNLAGRTVLEVELVNDSEKKIHENIENSMHHRKKLKEKGDANLTRKLMKDSIHEYVSKLREL